MPAYHYTREAGESGQVLAAEGVPAGRVLATLLATDRPPLRGAIEIAAAIADILCIAEEDAAVHGNLDPRAVYVDERGNVSIEGFGVHRAYGLAPEGRGDVATADIYGLGVVLHSMLADEPFGEMPNDPDEHDDLVISRVLAMDFRAVQGRRWVEDVRRFLCNILASIPEERPQPLDAANVLGSVADQVPGDGLVEWAAGTNTAARSLKAVPAAPSEILGGPTSLSAPLARGQVRQAPAAKGESTSFWSREKIAQMLAEEDDEPMPAPSNVVPMRAETPRAQSQRNADIRASDAVNREFPRPPIGGGGGEDLPAPRRLGAQSAPYVPAGRDSSTQHAISHARDTSAAYARDSSAAYARDPAPIPSPVSNPHSVPMSALQRDQSAPPPPSLPRPIAAPPIENDALSRSISPPSNPSGRSGAAPANRPESSPQPTRSAPPQPSRVEPTRSPYSAPQAERGAYDPVFDEPPPAKGGSGMMIGVAVVVVLGLLCAGSLALGGGAWFMAGTTPEATTSTSEPAAAKADKTTGGETAGKTGGEPPANAASGSAPAAAASAPATTPPAATTPATTPPAPTTPATTTPATTPPAATTPAKSPAPSTTTTTASKSTSSTSTSSGSASKTSTSGQSSASSSAPKPATTKPAATPAPVAKPAPVAAPAPASGPYTVRFSIPGKEGRIQCGDGKDAEFVGSTTLSFEGNVTCRIMADKKRGVVSLERATSVSCSDAGTVLSCSGG